MKQQRVPPPSLPRHGFASSVLEKLGASLTGVMTPGDWVSWLRPEQFFATSKMIGRRGTSLALPWEAPGQEVPRYILAGTHKSLVGGHSPISLKLSGLMMCISVFTICPLHKFF